MAMITDMGTVMSIEDSRVMNIVTVLAMDRVTSTVTDTMTSIETIAGGFAERGQIY